MTDSRHQHGRNLRAPRLTEERQLAYEDDEAYDTATSEETDEMTVDLPYTTKSTGLDPTEPTFFRTDDVDLFDPDPEDYAAMWREVDPTHAAAPYDGHMDDADATIGNMI